jgi:hypothetical protein
MARPGSASLGTTPHRLATLSESRRSMAGPGMAWRRKARVRTHLYN